jgi:hypothetical protein
MGRDAYRVWWKPLREMNHFENLGLGGRIILQFIFKKNG